MNYYIPSIIILEPLREIKPMYITLQESIASIIFNKRLLTLLKQYENTNAWINFNNVSSDVVVKTFPDHRKVTSKQGDPVGIYAYPVDWVLQNPSTIYHGPSFKYARIIRPTGNMVDISNWNADDWIEHNVNKLQLLKVRPQSTTDLTDWQGFAKTLIGQYDLSTISKLHQEALVKLGYYAIFDTAGQIDPSEPSQAIFLTRSSYDVITTISNSHQNQTQSGKGTLQSAQLTKYLMRTIAGLGEKPDRSKVDVNMDDIEGISVQYTAPPWKLTITMADGENDKIHAICNGVDLGEINPDVTSLHQLILKKVSPLGQSKAPDEFDDIPF